MVKLNFLKDRFSYKDDTQVFDIEKTNSSGALPEKSIGQQFDSLAAYNERFPEPTEEEYQTLPRTLGHAPYATYLICLIEFAERASFFGVKGRLNNFIQLPLPEGGNGAGAPPSGTQLNAGALGLGLQTASALTLLLTFLSYLTPLWGGYISDKKWGRMKTIWYGVWVGALSHIILIIASIPSVIKEGHALAPTIISILTLAIGTGLIKPNLLPLLYDQFPHKRDVVETKEDGSRVIIMKEQSLERMTLFFYWSINVGSFLSLATSYCAKRVGFWLAFLIPGIVYFIMVPVLILLAPLLKKEKPNGVSVIGEAFKVLKIALTGNFIKRSRNNEFWNHAKPTNMIERGAITDLEETNKKGKKKVSWTDQFVEDVKVTFNSCKLFLFFVIYLVNDGGLGGIQNSQANSMTNNGVPNDLFDNFNPLTIIVFIPILDYGIYPLLRRWNIDFKPVYRIFFGFMLAAISQAVGAIIQWRVYETSPCGYHATDCDIGTGVSPISVWVEVVLYVLQASSECFAMTAGYEIAYTRAPDHMKGLVMALFLFMSSLAAALSEACAGALVDPDLIWPFVGFAVAGVVCAFWFLWTYRDLDKIMDAERLEKEQKMRDAYMAHLAAEDAINANSEDIKSIVSGKIEKEQEALAVEAVASVMSNRKT